MASELNKPISRVWASPLKELSLDGALDEFPYKKHDNYLINHKMLCCSIPDDLNSYRSYQCRWNQLVQNQHEASGYDHEFEELKSHIKSPSCLNDEEKKPSCCGSFSNDAKLNSVVGHILHSSIHVPYHNCLQIQRCLKQISSSYFYVLGKKLASSRVILLMLSTRDALSRSMNLLMILARIWNVESLQLKVVACWEMKKI